MADLVFVALTIGFFVLVAGLVRLCDHVMGPDPSGGTGPAGVPTGATAPPAASDPAPSAVAP